MDVLSFGQLVDVTGGKLLQGDVNARFGGVSTDSRTVRRGELFFALRGERFDGHDFIPDAVAAGAAGVVAERLPDGIPREANCVLVDDTLHALQALAAWYRARFPASTGHRRDGQCR